MPYPIITIISAIPILQSSVFPLMDWYSCFCSMKAFKLKDVLGKTFHFELLLLAVMQHVMLLR